MVNLHNQSVKSKGLLKNLHRFSLMNVHKFTHELKKCVNFFGHFWTRFEFFVFSKKIGKLWV